MHPRRSLLLIGTVCLTALLACESPDSTDSRVLNSFLANDSANHLDLIARQRDFINHIYARELDALPGYVAPTFVWTLPLQASGVSLGPAPETLSMLEFVAGAYPDDLGLWPTVFHVESASDSLAVVFAGVIHRRYGLTTHWRLIDGEWRAESMAGLIPDDS